MILNECLSAGYCADSAQSIKELICSVSHQCGGSCPGSHFWNSIRYYDSYQYVTHKHIVLKDTKTESYENYQILLTFCPHLITCLRCEIIINVCGQNRSNFGFLTTNPLSLVSFCLYPTLKVGCNSETKFTTQ